MQKFEGWNVCGQCVVGATVRLPERMCRRLGEGDSGIPKEEGASRILF